MKNGFCKLCLEEKPLCNSHIIPEFAYKPLYDKKGRLLIFSEFDFEYKQKGLREYLLCECCENKFSEYERFLKNELERLINFIESNEISKDIEFFEFKTNYHKLKTSILIILWRMHLSKLKQFKSYNLGPYAEKLRILLLNNIPISSNDYPILISRFIVEGEIKYKHHKDFHSHNDPRKVEKNYTLQSFAIYGFFFFIIIKENFDLKYYESICLRENKVCIFNKSSFEVFPLNSKQFNLIKSDKLKSKFDKLDYD